MNRLFGYPIIRTSDLASPERLREIYASDSNYYISGDWSSENYRALARAGFISITSSLGRELILLPEMQSHYALLDFGDLRTSRSMRRWMKSDACTRQGYQFLVGNDCLAGVIEGLKLTHRRNWMIGNYEEVMHELTEQGPFEEFEMMSSGLVTGEGRLVAGEVGYRIGKVYTSLTGFFDRSDRAFSNSGKLQLLALGEYLRDADFAFWNLGHPWMQYKIDLGARVLPRHDFLERWLPEAWPHGLDMLGGEVPRSPFV